MKGQPLSKDADLNHSMRATLMILVLFSASGATCHRNAFFQRQTAPPAFTGMPTLEQVIYNVNANTDRVRQLHTDTAKLSVAGFPGGLRATMDLERPQRFRLRARLNGPGLDMGSNDERFWFWTKLSPQPVVLYASHAAYRQSPARQAVPIEPKWLIDALGLIRMEPGGYHDGPYQAGPGQFYVRSSIQTASGPMTRVLLIDQTYGWILEQHLLDARGQTVAVSRTSNHLYDATTGVSLPHRIEIEVPTQQLSLVLNVTEYQINQPSTEPQVWTMPPFEGYTPIDVADPRFQLTNQPTATRPISPPQPAYPRRSAHRPTFRGYER